MEEKLQYITLNVTNFSTNFRSLVWAQRGGKFSRSENFIQVVHIDPVQQIQAVSRTNIYILTNLYYMDHNICLFFKKMDI